MYNNENINFQNYHFLQLVNVINFLRHRKIKKFFLLELFLVCVFCLICAEITNLKFPNRNTHA